MDTEQQADLEPRPMDESRSANPSSEAAIRRLPDGSIDQAHYADRARLYRAEAWQRIIKSIWALIATRRKTGD